MKYLDKFFAWLNRGKSAPIKWMVFIIVAFVASYEFFLWLFKL